MRILALVAISLMSYSAQASDELDDARKAACEAHEKMAQIARKGAIRGDRSALISLIRSMDDTKINRDTNEKVARWGFAYEYREPEELRKAFMKACLESFTGAHGMVKVRDR